MTLEQNIWVGLITGVIGMGYFVYGKKQSRIIPFISGISLMVYPYFIDSLMLSICIGAFLIIVPFVVSRN